MYKGDNMTAIKVGTEKGEVLIALPSEIKIGERIEAVGGDEGVMLIVKACYVTPQKLYRDEEWLRNAYLKEGKTMAELGSMFNVSPMTICTWLDKFGIETRSRGRRK